MSSELTPRAVSPSVSLGRDLDDTLAVPKEASGQVTQRPALRFDSPQKAGLRAVLVNEPGRPHRRPRLFTSSLCPAAIRIRLQAKSGKPIETDHSSQRKVGLVDRCVGPGGHAGAGPRQGNGGRGQRRETRATDPTRTYPSAPRCRGRIILFPARTCATSNLAVAPSGPPPAGSDSRVSPTARPPPPPRTRASRRACWSGTRPTCCPA